MAANNHHENGKSKDNDVDLQMQKVLQLLAKRTKGKATNDQVEKAVSKILSTAGLGPPPNSQVAPKPPKKKDAAVPSPQIEMDTENYDDNDDDDDKDDQQSKPIVPIIVTRGRKRKPRTLEQEAAEELKRQYEEIPLGRQGAHMLTAFGDGPFPIPETVSAVLLGARKLLQVTIQDARALRRQTKQQFKKAQHQVAKGKRLKRDVKKQKPVAEAIPDPEMLYRAFIGYDTMQRETKCGFNFEQLKSLFPEEMRAYTKWNQMQEEFEKNEETPTEKEEGEPAATAEESPADKDPEPDPLQEGGHLQERAVQFDLRTNLMDPTGYMKFSEHRKGSFLPRKFRQEGDSEWEENRKSSGRGNDHQNNSNKDAGIWSRMSAKSARFLHWVGFDPDNGLPPPNDETTQALAFLGYDFVGRIVEQAIFLKNLSKAKEADGGEVDERTILLELEEGEQLEKSDIDNAMRDIRPAAMYSTNTSVATSQKPVAQLYFGPGFEDRLEMELDLLMLAQDGTNPASISEEEAQIRKEEDNLFAKMAEPPSTNNAVMYLLGKDEDDNEDAEAELTGGKSPKTPFKRRRKLSD